MKLLALVFLVGFALASAVPVPSHDLSLKEDDLEYMLALAASEDDDTQTELGRKLKERLDDILEKIKDAIEKGNGLKDDYITKAKEIRKKLRDLKVDLGEKAKELIEKLKEKGKDYWQIILDRLTGKDSGTETFMMADDDKIKTELGKKLREHLDEILGKIKDAIEHGKTVREDTIEKAKEIREKLRDLKVDLGEKAKEFIEEMKKKGKEYWQKILDRLTGKDSGTETFMMADDDDVKTELGKKLKERLDEILEKIKDAIEHGKTVREDTIEKLKEIRGKLKDMKIDIGNKAKELIEKLKEKAKDYWQKILDRLGEQTTMMRADDDVKTELGKKLQERLDEILEKIKDAIEHGKTVKEDTLNKVKEIREQMKDAKVDLGNKAKELLKNLREKAKDYWQKILDKLTGNDMHAETFMMADDDETTELGKKLRKHFDEILEKVKDAIENGKSVREETLEKLKEIRKQLKDLKVDIGAKAKELIEKLKEKARDYWQKILDRMGVDKSTMMKAEISEMQQGTMDDIREKLMELKEKLRGILDAEKIKEKIEKVFGKGSEIAEQLINKLKDHGKDKKQKILEWIDRVLGEDNTREKRSIKDLSDRIKNYFKNFQIEVKEKFVKVCEFFKEHYGKSLEAGKNTSENLKKLAREFIADTKVITKDVAEQAKEFFREYKDDLGTIYKDVREKIERILKKE